eukprot:1175764-Prorocentrum_minimum.AAC.7
MALFLVPRTYVRAQAEAVPAEGEEEEEEEGEEEEEEEEEEECVHLVQASLRHRSDFEVTASLPLGNARPGVYRSEIAIHK